MRADITCILMNDFCKVKSLIAVIAEEIPISVGPDQDVGLIRNIPGASFHSDGTILAYSHSDTLW